MRLPPFTKGGQGGFEVSLKNVVELSILGQKLAIQSTESEEHVRGVESYLAEKIEEVRGGTKAVATLDLALIVALNVAGELIKTRQTLQSIEKRSGELAKTIQGVIE